MTHTRIEDKVKIRQIIFETFNGDQDLFDKFHFINNDIDAAIENTFFKIQELIDNYGSEFYAMYIGSDLVGYINVAPEINTFHSFGLKKKIQNS